MTTTNGTRQRLLGAGLLALLAAVALLAAARPAEAAFGIESFEAKVAAADGSEETQAGARPFQDTVHFELNKTAPDSENMRWADGNFRKAIVSLPPGLVGDPNAVPTCARPELELFYNCPAASQIGVITLT